MKSRKSDRNFWSKLPKPFFVLAPMANVTDSVFRRMFAKYGKPHVTYTEFVSADGLNSAGKEKLLIDLEYTETERPIVAQLFTGHPEEMERAARLIAELGFDGLDINMGCPDRAVQKQGGGAALIRNPKSALEVLEAARRGVTIKSEIRISKSEGNLKSKKEIDANLSIPVSVKTRIGFNSIDLTWIEFLLKQNLPALTVHLRTRKEMSDVPAHWDLMPEIMAMRNEISPHTLIIGNGDVGSIEQGIEHARKYGCDGIMVGRGAFGKPWFFNYESTSPSEAPSSHEERRGTNYANATNMQQRLKILVEHTKLFEKTFLKKKRTKNFDVMKKHFKAYVSGWDGAKELRTKLMNTKGAKEVESIISDYLQKNSGNVNI